MRPSASDLISRMRPRGESISVPSSEKVGQYGRQSPQCTQRSTPSTLSPWRASGTGGLASVTCAIASDASHEPPRVEDAAGIEALLDALHEAERGPGVVPHRDPLLDRERGPL